MAPPSPRRPGFSRRAQYGLFAGYVLAVLGALLGVLLIVTSRVDPAGHSAIQGVLADIVSPISRACRSFVRVSQSAFEGSSAYFHAASKNSAMSAELKAARTALIKGQADAQENARLRRLLGIATASKALVAAAPLISSTGSSSRRYATLGAGAGAGVRIGQPVRGPLGLVGRVIQTGRAVSRIILITDAENIVPVKRVKDGVPGLALGNGTGALEVRPLSVGNDPFRLGDIFVTSGTGGIYAPGIPVAMVVQHGRDKTVARPIEDPAALDFAIVEPVFMPEAPPAPSDFPQKP